VTQKSSGHPAGGGGGRSEISCMRQHTSAYVSMRQHSSAFVSIRQHTSAYVSIRQHTAGGGGGCRLRAAARSAACAAQRQYLYFGTSKASKLSTCGGSRSCAPMLLSQHTSAYVSIRQHTSAYDSIRQHTTAYDSIRQHTSNLRWKQVLRADVFEEVVQLKPYLCISV
jgi:hypothetical protein